MLRNSNLVLWDHETQSWWQQGTFEAIVGEMAGTRMPVLPASVMPWKDFKGLYPEGQVLRDPPEGIFGLFHPYGRTPYWGYDQRPNPTHLFQQEADPRLAAMERVIGVAREGEAVAYPFSALRERDVVYGEVGGREVVVLYSPAVRTVQDAGKIAEGREVGSAGVFVPEVDGRRLTLERVGEGRFRDRETGSLWSAFGQALDGPLSGERLPPVLSTQGFWFYWAIVHPETRIYGR